MNTDSNPPLPQNETAVAASLANPKIAGKYSEVL